MSPAGRRPIRFDDLDRIDWPSQPAISPDGRFTVAEVECLGACGFPTPIIVDEDFVESVTPERVPGILARYS